MSTGTLEILLVEDNEAHVELIHRAFEPHGKKFKLTVADSLAEARKILKKASPGLMIVAYKLPDGKGTELLPGDQGKLTFPVVMLTGHGDEKIATAAMKAGALDYIVKSDQTLADMPNIIERSMREWQHITERGQAETALEHSNRALETLSACNKVLIHTEGEAQFLNDICHAIVEQGGYKLTWIGHAEHDRAKSVRPIAEAGFGEGYLESLNITWADTKRGRGPAGTAIRTRKPSVAQNIQDDPGFSPWRETALRHGYRSCVALPIIIDGEVFGVLCVYAPESHAFIEDEVNLLAGLADDICHGISMLRTRVAHLRAEKDLRSREAQLSLIANHISDIIFTIGVEPNDHFRFLRVNQRFIEATELKESQIVGKPVQEVIPEPTQELVLGKYKEAIRTGQSVHWDEISVYPAGKKTGEVTVAPIFDASGSCTQLIGTVHDVTEQKQMEEALRREQKQTRQIIDTARDAFVGMDEEGNITDWNPRAEEMLGWNRDEVMGKKVAETFIPEEFREAHTKGMERYLATGEGPILNQPIEITALHHDGHAFPVELSIVSAHSEDSVSFNAFIRDTSARQKAREKLDESRGQLRQSLIGAIVAVSKAVEARDPYTAGHQQRVARLARCIAQEMRLDAERIEGLRMGVTIHDIGKIHLPAEILSNPGKLSAMEFELIKTHAQVGYEILKDIKFPWPVAGIAWQHHERINGTGYPQGLKGDEICLEARIVAVADVVEAMSSHRPYRPALGIDAALEEIETHRGQWFDPAAVDACLKIFHEKKFSFD